MRKNALLIATGLVLASCTHNDAGAGNDADARSAGAIDGAAAYHEHCAGCHETGMLGAPREGEPEDWQERSSLWQAVLMEHAKTGYFEMQNCRMRLSTRPQNICSRQRSRVDPRIKPGSICSIPRLTADIGRERADFATIVISA